MQRSESEFAPIVVAALWERAFGSCEVCGRGLAAEWRGVQWSTHHRRPRGMGGSDDPRLGLPSNGLVVCGHGTSGCHGRIERNRAAALAAGFLVASHDDPAEIPVRLWLFGRVLLREDGLVGNP